MREDGIKGIKREDDGWLMGSFSSRDLFTCEVIGSLFFLLIACKGKQSKHRTDSAPCGSASRGL